MQYMTSEIMYYVRTIPTAEEIFWFLSIFRESKALSMYIRSLSMVSPYNNFTLSLTWQRITTLLWTLNCTNRYTEDVWIIITSYKFVYSRITCNRLKTVDVSPYQLFSSLPSAMKKPPFGINISSVNSRNTGNNRRPTASGQPNLQLVHQQPAAKPQHWCKRGIINYRL